jgi:SAM-dependent methyltransferase
MIGVAHLVWAPLGPAPLQDFLKSYHAHPVGADHELVIVLNGAGPEGPADDACREALLAELEGTEHRLIELERPVLDLAAYGLVAQRLEHERLCFLNSYSVVLAADWLGHLARALEDPTVGLVGASGSWESQAEWVRGKLGYWPYQLAGLRNARRDYPRFPNPHIRTTAFMLQRSLLLELGLESAHDKHATYLLESGRRSITAQVAARGLRSVVVGRDGRAYDVDAWPASHTYRSGAQSNLLVADRRTADWLGAPNRLRRRLSNDAWGACPPRPGARVEEELRPSEKIHPVNLLERCRERLAGLVARVKTAPGFIRFEVRRWRLARKYLRGSGLEVGALHSPLRVPSGARVRYVDRMDIGGLRKHYPELAVEKLVEVDVIDDGEKLGTQSDASVDFIIANHFIEHTEDPLGTLANHLRVIRPGGILYLAVPNRHRTFDADREPTSLEHVIEDHRHGPSSSRPVHQEEWARLVEKVPAGDVSRRVRELDQQDYSIHFHAWNPQEFRALLGHAHEGEGLPFTVEALQPNEHEFIAILRRT